MLPVSNNKNGKIETDHPANVNLDTASSLSTRNNRSAMY